MSSDLRNGERHRRLAKMDCREKILDNSFSKIVGPTQSLDVLLINALSSRQKPQAWHPSLWVCRATEAHLQLM